MGHLVEIVFEGAPRPAELLQSLLDMSLGIVGIDVDGCDRPSHTNAQSLVADLGFSLTVRLKKFNIPQAGIVTHPAIRLFRTDSGQIDVEMNMDIEDVPNLKGFAPGLLEIGQQLALEHGVRSFYAGLEPAIDLETRLFTDGIMGPFKLTAVDSSRD